MFSDKFSAKYLKQLSPKEIFSIVRGQLANQSRLQVPHFNRDQALQMACLCRLAYLAKQEDILTLRDMSKTSIFEPNYHLESYLYADTPLFGDVQSSCYGILVTHPEYTIVALRGTRYLNDWLFNFLAHANSQEIHSGVSYLTDSLWQSLVQFISCPEYCHKQIILTGHSLGGAVVTLVTHLLYQAFPQSNFITYTFGAPPIASCSLNVGNNFFRLRTPGDFVPDLFKVLGQLEGFFPFTDSLSSYKHSGQEYLIDEQFQISQIPGGTYHVAQKLALAAKRLSSNGKNLSEKPLQAITREHQLIRYIQLLNYGSLPVELFNQ